MATMVVPDAPSSQEGDDEAKLWSTAFKANAPKEMDVGLQIALERATQLSRFERSMASFLFDIASLYDSCKQDFVDVSGDFPPRQRELREKLLTLHALLKGVSKKYMQNIYSPFQKAILSNESSVKSARTNYVLKRNKAAELQRGIQLEQKSLTQMVETAEVAILRWYQTLQQDNGKTEYDGKETFTGKESDPAWEQFMRNIGKVASSETARIILLVREVKSKQDMSQTTHSKLQAAIADTNSAYAQALATLQSAETSRLAYLRDSVFLAMANYEDVVIEKGRAHSSASMRTPEKEVNLAETLEKTRKDIMANIFQQKNVVPYEPGQGLFEAETLGLPHEIGELRDQMKTKFARHEEQLASMKILASMLDKLIATADMLASGLEKRTQNGVNVKESDPNVSKPESLTRVASSCVGSSTANASDLILSALREESEAFRAWARTLRDVRVNGINPFLSTTMKQLELEVDSDEAAWKLLCDAARKQSKVESRYKQTRYNNDKIRERTKSAELIASRRGSEDLGAELDKQEGSKGSQANRPGNKVSKAFARLSTLQNRTNSSVSDHSSSETIEQQFTPQNVGKAFGNMLSAIPNSAGNAMKMLNVDGIAKKEVIETKERQSLDSADATKSRAMTSYKIFTEQRLEKVGEYEKSAMQSADCAWDAIRAGLTSLDVVRGEMGKVKTSLQSAALDADTSRWLKTIKAAPAEGTAKTSDTAPESSSVVAESRLIDAIVNLESDGSDEAFPDEFVNMAKTLVDKYGKKLEQSTSSVARQDLPRNNVGHQSPGRVGANKVFYDLFFQGKDGPDLPKVLHSFSCSHRPKEKGISLVTPTNGRLYLTQDSVCFAGLNERKLRLSWEDVISFKNEKSFIGSENAILVTFNSDNQESSMVIGKLQNRDLVLECMQRISEVASSAKNSVAPGASDKPVINADSVIKDKMVRIFEKSLQNVSIDRFYTAIFSEGIRTSAGPFYKDFLTKEECFDIVVGDWEFADEGSLFKAQWCGESYQQKRIVSFQFNRKTHLYIGPPVAKVIQTQYCRNEGTDRCIIAMALEFEGIPYADCFVVHARWATRRHGASDVKVEVGIQVEFRKKTMLAGQIKAGTITETTPVHERLFEEARKALGADVPQAEEEDESEPVSRSIEAEKTQQSGGIIGILNGIFATIPIDTNFLLGAGSVVGLMLLQSYFLPSSSTERVSVSQSEIREMKAQLAEIQKTLSSVLAAVQERQ